MAKDIKYNVEARELLKEGVDALSNTVDKDAPAIPSGVNLRNM